MYVYSVSSCRPNNMYSIYAVSYTHLDVYKRQFVALIFHCQKNKASRNKRNPLSVLATQELCNSGDGSVKRQTCLARDANADAGTSFHRLSPGFKRTTVFNRIRQFQDCKWVVHGDYYYCQPVCVLLWLPFVRKSMAKPRNMVTFLFLRYLTH